jgi:hypothetical protein
MLQKWLRRFPIVLLENFIPAFRADSISDAGKLMG